MSGPFKSMRALLDYALICAIRDRESYADGDSGPYGDEARAEAKAFRAYRKRRFGQDRSPIERVVDQAELVSIHDLKAPTLSPQPLGGEE